MIGLKNQINKFMIPQEQYNYILQNMPIVCVDVCILYNNGIFLVKRNTEPCKNMWWMPGGRVYKGETLRDCAKRKAVEEMNIECTVGPIVHVDETIFNTGPNNIPVHSVNTCFLLIPSKPEIDIILDKYSEKYTLCKYIHGEFHPYVQQCLKGSGLTWKNKQ